MANGLDFSLLGQSPGFENAFNSFQAGKENRRKTNVRNAFASYKTDPKGAINTLMEDDPEAAIKLQAYDTGQQDRAARVSGAGSLARGDYQGATDAYAGVGDLEGVSTIQKAQIDDFNRQREYFASVAPSLTAVADQGGDVAGAWEHLSGDLDQLRVPKATQAKLRDGFKSDPKGTLAALTAGAQRDLKFEHAGNDIYVLDGDSGQVVHKFEGSQDPKYMVVPEGGKVVPVGGHGNAGEGVQAPSGHAPSAAGPSKLAGGFDSIYSSFVAPHEGGYTASDGNGKPANFGINQGANPDINVRDLNPETAKKILHDRYWAPSGADKLPPALQAVHFDTAVNMGVGAANNLLQASGGDPQRYLQLREQRYRSIAQNDPSKADKLPGWLSRNQDLAQYVGGGQSSSAAAPARGGVNERGDPAGTIYGEPKKPEWTEMSPAESARYGSGIWLRNKNGDVKPAVAASNGRTRWNQGFAQQQDEDIKAIQDTTGVNANLDRAMSLMDQGKLHLGPIPNMSASVRTFAGMGNEESVNNQSFRNSLEKMRNDSLRLNKGVQTEGDAVRAWTELFTNLNDQKYVRERLQQIKDLNARAVNFRAESINQRREDAGLQPLDPRKFQYKPQGGSANPGAKPKAKPSLAEIFR